MTHGAAPPADPSDNFRRVVIQPAGREAASIDSTVQLKDLATGGTLSNTLGAGFELIGRQLCEHPDTLQSVTRTWTASIDGKVVGQYSGIAHDEYAPRRRVSARLIWRGSRPAGLRVYADWLRRWLTRTSLGPWASGQFYIESLAVDRSARRQGIGAQLLDHAQRMAGEQACHALCLNALASNVAAVSLYAAAGFQVVARRGQRLKLLKALTSGFETNPRSS